MNGSGLNILNLQPPKDIPKKLHKKAVSIALSDFLYEINKTTKVSYDTKTSI